MDCSTLMRDYSRYLLVIFNLVFSLTGVLLVSAGLSAKGYYHEYDQFLDDRYIYVSDLLIVVGCFIFFIAFVGCCGALRENACMTSTYSTMLIVICILELIIGVSAVLLKSKTESFVRQALEKTLPQYNSNNTEITDVWDNIQKGLHCCGVNNYTDWINLTNTTHNEIPLSCCMIPSGTSGDFNCTPSYVYKEGCLDKFGDYIRDNTSVVEGIGIGVAVIQLLGILLACYLTKHIRSDYETV